jgi:hypothetical protein
MQYRLKNTIFNKYELQGRSLMWPFLLDFINIAGYDSWYPALEASTNDWSTIQHWLDKYELAMPGGMVAEDLYTCEKDVVWLKRSC